MRNQCRDGARTVSTVSKSLKVRVPEGYQRSGSVPVNFSKPLEPEGFSKDFSAFTSATFPACRREPEQQWDGQQRWRERELLEQYGCRKRGLLLGFQFVLGVA